MSLSRLSISERALARVDTVVQKYRIERLIGIGGMAAVYAARHRNGHRVAMKFLLERFQDDPDISHLFSREAYVANQVGHPGAVPVLDDDVDEQGCAFLVMPLLEGETLRARWERAGRRLPLAEVGVLMADVLEVLQSAHAKGIVHRDIKPDNLFVTTKGEIRVLDFGIARRMDGDGSTTGAGRMIGTPAFMPPEQALGEREAIGPHSDCWAVGATIFSLISGELVHKTDNAGAQLAAAATRRARSLADIVPEVPSSLVRFVDKALAFEPSERWRTGREMREALLRTFEDALDESIGSAATRIRAELVAELLPNSADLQASDTQAPKEKRQAEIPLALPGKGVAEPTPTLPEGRTRSPLAEGGDVPTIMAAGAAKTPTRKGRQLWGVGLAGIAMLGLVGLLLSAVQKPSRRSDSPAAATSAIGTAVTALPISPMCTKEAELYYREGLTALQQSSWSLAYPAFEKAAAADPRCPEVHLQLAVTGYSLFMSLEKERELFRRALSMRDVLSERDRLVLDAHAPLIVSEPADVQEAVRRLDAAVIRFPHDAQILTAAGNIGLHLPLEPAVLEHCLDLGRRANDIDAKDADAWQLQARALLRSGRFEEGMAALDNCLEVAPGSADCLEERVYEARWRGECAAGDTAARRWIANMPAYSRPYLYLANLLASEGAAPETVEAALQQWRSHADNAGEDMVEATHTYYRAALAGLNGDFAKVEKLTGQLFIQLRDSPTAFYHARAFALLTDVLTEMGKGERAALVARKFLSQKAAWTEGSWSTMHHEPFLIGALLRQGKISRDDWNTSAELWERQSSSRLTSHQVWVFRWGGAVSNAPQIASEAWARRPESRQVGGMVQQPPFYRALAEMLEGHIALMAGELAPAIKSLESSTKNCDSLAEPLNVIRAQLWLGQAKQQVGDTAGACKAYAVVLQRWGNAKPRSITADEAKRRRRALGCTF